MNGTLTALPRGLVGACALFWGWQTGNLLLGVALAAAVEAANFVTLRLELDETDYRRVADFCAVLFAGIAVLLVTNRGMARGVLSSIQWFPVAVLPLYLAQRFGEGLSTSALFLYVRRQLRRDPSYPNPAVDLSGPYAAVLVVAAGVANARSGYFVGVALLVGCALFALRPRGSSIAAFSILLAAGVGGGLLGQDGLSRVQGLIEAWIDDWLVMLPDDPERTRTNIGTIGRIKQHDAVAMRVFAKPADAARPKLLHIASFNDYQGGTWLAREPAALAPTTTGDTRSVPIVLRTQGGRALLALPAGTVEVVGVDETGLVKTGLGAVLANAPKGWLRYEARFGDAPAQYAPPGAFDLVVPRAERAALRRVFDDLSLSGKAAEDIVPVLERHFAGFKYSTWREKGPAEGMTGLGDFLLNTRTGHCEYFAAATTLLLRASGIPARYATGYAVLDYSELEGAWLVRARHAHAWSRAWIGGRWVDVDLTPPSWAEDESELAPPWERLLDLARWAQFRWATRAEGDASNWWWAAGGVLALFLGWRLRNRRRKAIAGSLAEARRTFQGTDSEFYAIERDLATRFRPRRVDEPMPLWFADIKKNLPDEKAEKISVFLDLHQRYRFDPLGLSADERAALGQASVDAGA